MDMQYYDIVINVFWALMICLVLLAFVRLLIKSIKYFHAPVKSVEAEVIDKNIIETFSKYSGNGKQQKYVVVFSANGKKKSFYISHLTYGGYRIGEKGILKYKGDELIDFC